MAQSLRCQMTNYIVTKGITGTSTAAHGEFYIHQINLNVRDDSRKVRNMMKTRRRFTNLTLNMLFS